MAGVPFDIPDEETARAYLATAVDGLADAAADAVAHWTRDRVRTVAGARGIDDALPAELAAATDAAADEAAAHTRAGLRALRDVDPTTPGVPGPLEVVRDAYRYPTRVLRDAGVPATPRDDFEVRHFPDDDYGLRIQSFAELPGGDDLAVLHAVWGSAKAAVLRERRGSLFE
jgi:hypothetical protein